MAFLSKLVSKIKEYVKLAPWLQYVGLQVGLIPGLNHAVAVSAVVASAISFALTIKTLGPNDPRRREGLAIIGYPALVVGTLLNHPGYQFVGGALVMTSFVYELIYP